MNSQWGTIGFIFACLAVCFGWLPYAGGLFWLLGAVFSCIGLCYRPRTFAWIGFIISFFWVILWLVMGLTLGTLAALTLFPYYIW